MSVIGVEESDHDRYMLAFENDAPRPVGASDETFAGLEPTATRRVRSLIAGSIR